ncbi:MAG TPA: carboxylating nicotinate-nucleotide diphosphorylase [Bacteroidales bacterium]|nr:carboxylating nicotinate-nucleotide diphosphorylase [Bacteroidales bacterium]HQQ20493.1 carboxylating nicotinate-nucleotide diphosphorylase [Bacteroidales bacterium]
MRNNFETIVKQALAEDIGSGDHSSLASIDPTIQGQMKLLVKEPGILCGIDLAREVIRQVDPNISMETYFSDGDTIAVGDIVFMLKGAARNMLTAERTLLNFLQLMSGIATNSRQYVDAISGTGAVILDTRKTTPGLRFVEKYAVSVGGAQNHRFGLFDMIMLKDNHIDFAGSIEKAIDKAKDYLKKNNLQLQIEVETRSLEEVQRVLNHGGVDRIMLDNFTPERMKEAIQLINKRVETEASGGITLKNVREYAETGVDFISIGALTHQIKSIDLSLKFIQ